MYDEGAIVDHFTPPKHIQTRERSVQKPETRSNVPRSKNPLVQVPSTSSSCPAIMFRGSDGTPFGGWKSTERSTTSTPFMFNYAAREGERGRLTKATRFIDWRLTGDPLYTQRRTITAFANLYTFVSYNFLLKTVWLLFFIQYFEINTYYACSK